MIRLPWWHLRDQPPPSDDLNAPQPGWVRVPTTIDALGDPDNWVWCPPENAQQWDARFWR